VFPDFRDNVQARVLGEDGDVRPYEGNQAFAAHTLEKLYDTGGCLRATAHGRDSFFSGPVGDAGFDWVPVQTEQFGFPHAVQDTGGIFPVESGKDTGLFGLSLYGPVADGKVPGNWFFLSWITPFFLRQTFLTDVV
jgi:hypothetical protein